MANTGHNESSHHLATSTSSLTAAPADDVHDLRDSGISMSDNANINNFNNASYEDFDSRTKQQDMNISNNMPPGGGDEKLENPPPIPPKSGVSFGGGGGGGSSLERRQQRSLGSSENVQASDILTPPENYSFPKMTISENGNDDTCQN